MNRAKGLSLFELLASMSLLGILCAISVPSFPQLKRSSLLKNEMRLFRDRMETAIIEAVEGAREITVELHEESYIIHDLRQASYLLKSPVTFRAPRLQKLLIHAGGSCSPGTITLTDGKDACSIVISLRCRVRATCESGGSPDANPH